MESQGGSIRGTISPEDVTTAIYAIHNEDSVGTFANSEGHFLIRALATGSYTLSIVPAEGYLPMILDDVEVTDGEVNNVGLIILEPADVVEGD
ncbi:MAG: carboxypeptidase-like regulatory domain-containing protein [Cyclobacteriaceae bacterium]